MLAADSASTRVLVFSCGCYFSTRVGRDTDCVIAVRIVTTCSIADGCIISYSSRWPFIHAAKTPFLIAFRGQADTLSTRHRKLASRPSSSSVPMTNEFPRRIERVRDRAKLSATTTTLRHTSDRSKATSSAITEASNIRSYTRELRSEDVFAGPPPQLSGRRSPGRR
jgi:hypothetical protein